MLAVVVNTCDVEHSSEVLLCVRRFLAYASARVCHWGSPQVQWEERPRDLLETFVLTRHACLLAVGADRQIVIVNPRTAFAIDRPSRSRAAANEITFSTSEDSAAMAACRRCGDLWFGRWHKPGMELVLVHSDRDAISAATGQCGCLFDDELQLWLVPDGKSAVYEAGADVVKVV